MRLEFYIRIIIIYRSKGFNWFFPQLIVSVVFDGLSYKVCVSQINYRPFFTSNLEFIK